MLGMELFKLSLSNILIVMKTVETKRKSGMVAHNCHPSVWEMEEEDSKFKAQAVQ